MQPWHITRATRIVVLKTALTYCERKVKARRRQMRYFRRNRPFSWFLSPKYWRIESDHALLFRGVINFRKQIANEGEK